MHISARFDAGNIEVVDATDPSDVKLRIRDDVGGEHKQWFCFRASGIGEVPCTFHITNAGTCSYPVAWKGYHVAASVDRQTWFRVPTSYEGGTLTFRHTPAADTVWYAYFAPYSQERHHDLVAGCVDAGARHEVLGQTLDGADLDLLTLGEGPVPVWIIARQHPGETMAEWWMEGLLERLLDADDALARALLSKATFYLVPNMNPDGSARGHLRTNAVGANLNREWHAPTMERAPEVKLVRDRMDATGVKLCLDIHGDEELPYVFISGPEGVPSWNEAREAVRLRFEQVYEQVDPDFQRVHGYGRSEPGTANMTMCSNQVAERYDALALTLEMPFKDNANAPDEAHGWSPERSRLLGAAVLLPIATVLAEL
ncbi:MAG: carboxypeptidase family protein [Alphaproteobacteria bacterium]|nr:carboxypeptidase family protein [Alphaproteobacteria bacterium]MCB9699237.1 carboxypeptidase family protein [Alphaproteobacteria bacterium]